MRALLLLLMVCQWATAQVDNVDLLDFADAEEDPVTGQLCVTRKYCLANTEKLAKRLPAQPCAVPLNPECNCALDDHCTNGTAPFCIDCRCSPNPEVRTAFRIHFSHTGVDAFMMSKVLCMWALFFRSPVCGAIFKTQHALSL